MSALSNLRKRRGVAKRSLTNLFGKIRDLETEPNASTAADRAEQLLTRLQELDASFRAAHLDVIDLIEEESDDLDKEHEVLDRHEDEISTASLRLRSLMKSISSSADSSSTRPLSRKLSRVERRLQAAEKDLASVGDSDGKVPLLEQYLEQLSDLKKELSTVYGELIVLDLSDEHELIKKHTGLESLHFKCSHRVRELLSVHKPPPLNPLSARGEITSKLPKLEVPTFDGDILYWQRFWEQYEVSVHNHNRLSNAEKLVYLQQAIQGGSARTVIEGLSRSGEQYSEAVSCLKARYSRPRLIHRAHVRTIMDIPPLKDGTGKELRRLHDVLLQHLRALKTMKAEPNSSFITSIIELKLDPTTLFEWQKHTQEKVDEVPHYQDCLEFIDLRAQASESLSATPKKKPGKETSFFGAGSDMGRNHCILCTSERHPLYACPKFKAMSHDSKLSTVKKNKLCLNCFGSGHFAKLCKSAHKCRKCQRSHHTLLHVESQDDSGSNQKPPRSPPSDDTDRVASHAAVKLRSSSLLMTCRILVFGPDGSSVEARALLDNGSTSSFISEHLAQTLRLPRSRHKVRVSGIAESTTGCPNRAVAEFRVSSVYPGGKKIDLTAIVLPKVTCNLPVLPVPFDQTWTHLSGLQLADPEFGKPQHVDILLGVEVFVDILRHGRRTGPIGSPVALETEFGWVLCGGSTDKATSPSEANLHITSLHAIGCDDDVLCKFWKVEEPPASPLAMSLEERAVVKHFDANHSRTNAGRFVVPLPRKPDVKAIGESRSQAVRRFMTLERSLHNKNQFQEVDAVVQEYLSLGHAEIVPPGDTDKPPSAVFYLPMHVVYKSSSSTTKVRAVFDASAGSVSGVSLNDTLLVGPTVHPPLVDVLLQFRMHRIALTTDVSKMYRAIELVPEDRDFHRFVWRAQPSQTLTDYRMTRATFGVSASCFAANMAVKQNAIELADTYPLAAQVVHKAFYVDDGLTGADSVESAITLQRQLQDLFVCGGFFLRKWNSSDPRVLQAIFPDLREPREIHPISGLKHDYTKTLGLEWNTATDTFHMTVSKLSSFETVTKRILVSDIAKVFDVLGWFSPAIVSMKILLQRVWEERVDWDDSVPGVIQEAWLQWRSELHTLMTKSVPRCYFPKEFQISSLQIHGFSDASEDAYAGVVYLRIIDVNGSVNVSLVTSKSKVAPIKRLSIPRLELCGAHVLARLLDHARGIFQVPLSDVFAWTDSTIVLNWLSGNPRRFKTYVGNRVSCIVDLVAPGRWGHVNGLQNPADCASRGLLPSALLNHDLWWTGPAWLCRDVSDWPKQPQLVSNTLTEEGEEISHHVVVSTTAPILPVERFSSLLRLKRVTAWAIRFARNCQARKKKLDRITSPLTAGELSQAEKYWISLVQKERFAQEIGALKSKARVPSSSPLVSLNPFLDGDDLLRVGGREAYSQRSYEARHPLIIHAKHPIVALLVRFEHIRLLHAGPLLLSTSLSRRYHIVRGRSFVRSITRACVICRRRSRPQRQMMGQLPAERVTSGSVFDKVGVDYAGPVYTKVGSVRKPTFVKTYVAVFVSLSVKAVHLEAVSDLTTDAFIACLRRFIARRGKPILIWSDNGSNFVGAARLLTELYEFLRMRETEHVVASYCASQGVTWEFIPERAPHFGGLWEAAVKSMKKHLRNIVGDTRLTFEELSTVLCQIEAVLNSRPLTPLSNEGEAEALTPGHFLVGRPLEALPDPRDISERPISSLRRWSLCQSLVKHFWKRWSSEYLVTLQRLNKWQHPLRNLEVDDIVLLRDETLVPSHWPLARVLETHPGSDGLVRVVKVKTSSGTFTRPVNKTVLLLPCKS